MENDLSAEELSTPVTITRGELNQLSHAFNNYQAMAEQVQSLATQIAQLRLLTATPASTPESSTIRTATLSQVPKVLQPDPFTGDRLELDTYLTRCQHVFLTQPSLFLTEQHKVLYAASYLKGNAYSWVKPLVQEYAKGASVPIEFTSFQKYSESLIFGLCRLRSNNHYNLAIFIALSIIFMPIWSHMWQDQLNRCLSEVCGTCL